MVKAVSFNFLLILADVHSYSVAVYEMMFAYQGGIVACFPETVHIRIVSERITDRRALIAANSRLGGKFTRSNACPCRLAQRSGTVCIRELDAFCGKFLEIWRIGTYGVRSEVVGQYENYIRFAAVIHLSSVSIYLRVRFCFAEAI
jgi:hypothetical protein